MPTSIYWDYGLLADRSQDGSTYFHHADWLGTERARTGPSGNTASQQFSLAFGDGFVPSTAAQGSSSQTVTIRFTNDSCSACSGQAPNEDRNLYVTGITVNGNQTIDPNSATYDNCHTGGELACSGDLTFTYTGLSSISIAAYGSPDGIPSVNAHMQLYVDGTLLGEWDVPPGSPTTYSMNLNGYSTGTSVDSTPMYDNNQFTGQERDEETGTTHFQFRQYSPVQGRWMSADPYQGSYDWTNPQSLNRYSYVMNNPFSFTDPSGLDNCDPATMDPETYKNCQNGGTQGSDGPTTGSEDSNSVYTLYVNAVLYTSDDTVYTLNVNVSTCVSCQNWALQGILGNAWNQFGTDYSPTSGGGGGGIPNNGTPWYKSCTALALGSGALSVGLDSIGLLPEGKGIEIGAETAARRIGNLKGYRGIVADQFGRKALTSASVSAKGAASGISLGQGLTDGDWIQSGLTVAGLIPVLGEGAALLSIGYDVYKTAKAVAACP